MQAAALNRISPDAENGHLLENIPTPWAKAKPEERHAILSGFLECVYADLKELPRWSNQAQVAVHGILKFMGTGSDPNVSLGNRNSEPEKGSEFELTGWWRRGRNDNG